MKVSHNLPNAGPGRMFLRPNAELAELYKPYFPRDESVRCRAAEAPIRLRYIRPTTMQRRKLMVVARKQLGRQGLTAG